MSEIDVHFARAEAVMNQLDMISRKINGTLNTLEQNTNHNLASWHSDAQIAYRGCQARWDAAAARMPLLLSTARVALERIMNGYRRGERKNTSLWTG